MNRRNLIHAFSFPALAAVFFFSSCAPQAAPAAVAIPSGIDHSMWDSLLKKHVNERGLVDYKAWKKNPEDIKALDGYLGQFAKPTSDPAAGDELGASAVNAYNAFAIRTILQNYPIESIKEIDDAFTQKTHDIGGRKVSLDQIEKGTAIPQVGPIAHALVICCAKSCPPLQRTAYTAENLEQLAATASEAWLSRPDLNNFEAGNGKIAVSKIFKWYEDDFKKTGGVKSFLKKHAPETAAGKIDGAEIGYLDYNWDLNAQ